MSPHLSLSEYSFLGIILKTRATEQMPIGALHHFLEGILAKATAAFYALTSCFVFLNIEGLGDFLVFFLDEEMEKNVYLAQLLFSLLSTYHCLDLHVTQVIIFHQLKKSDDNKLSSKIFTGI